MELHEILIYGVAALGCFILAILIKGNRQAVLQLATDLINKAEVIAQLQAAGIKVTSWLDHQIDVIVATLNKTGAWLATKTQEGISGMNQDTERSHE